MSAAEVVAQHRKLWRDTIASCSGCDWTRFGNITRTDLAHAAHQLDALKAAGYAVVDRSCPHDSWSGDGTGRWRCDECGADQGSQDVGEVRLQLVDSHTEVERLRHELSDAAARIRAFAKDNVFHGDMTPMAQRQWEKLADTIAGSETTP